jgi:hypothetical protein
MEENNHFSPFFLKTLDDLDDKRVLRTSKPYIYIVLLKQSTQINYEVALNNYVILQYNLSLLTKINK